MRDCLEYFRRLAAAAPRDLRTIQLRLAGVGAQKKSVPTIHMTTFYHLPRPDWYAAPDSSSPPEFPGSEASLYITLDPEDFPGALREMAAALEGVDWTGEPPRMGVVAALRKSRLGDGWCEVEVAQGGAAAVLDSLIQELRSREPAHTVLRILQSALLPEGR